MKFGVIKFTAWPRPLTRHLKIITRRTNGNNVANFGFLGLTAFWSSGVYGEGRIVIETVSAWLLFVFLPLVKFVICIYKVCLTSTFSSEPLTIRSPTLTKVRINTDRRKKHRNSVATDLRIWAGHVGARRRRKIDRRQRRRQRHGTASRGGPRRWPSRQWRDWRCAGADVDRCRPSHRWTRASACRRPSPADDSTCCPSARHDDTHVKTDSIISNNEQQQQQQMQFGIANHREQWPAIMSRNRNPVIPYSVESSDTPRSQLSTDHTQWYDAKTSRPRPRPRPATCRYFWLTVL